MLQYSSNPAGLSPGSTPALQYCKHTGKFSTGIAAQRQHILFNEEANPGSSDASRKASTSSASNSSGYCCPNTPSSNERKGEKISKGNNRKTSKQKKRNNSKNRPSKTQRKRRRLNNIQRKKKQVSSINPKIVSTANNLPESDYQTLENDDVSCEVNTMINSIQDTLSRQRISISNSWIHDVSKNLFSSYQDAGSFNSALGNSCGIHSVLSTNRMDADYEARANYFLQVVSSLFNPAYLFYGKYAINLYKIVATNHTSFDLDDHNSNDFIKTNLFSNFFDMFSEIVHCPSKSIAIALYLIYYKGIFPYVSEENAIVGIISKPLTHRFFNSNSEEDNRVTAGEPMVNYNAGVANRVFTHEWVNQEVNNLLRNTNYKRSSNVERITNIQFSSTSAPHELFKTSLDLMKVYHTVEDQATFLQWITNWNTQDTNMINGPYNARIEYNKFDPQNLLFHPSLERLKKLREKYCSSLFLEANRRPNDISDFKLKRGTGVSCPTRKQSPGEQAKIKLIIGNRDDLATYPIGNTLINNPPIHTPCQDVSGRPFQREAYNLRSISACTEIIKATGEFTYPTLLNNLNVIQNISTSIQDNNGPTSDDVTPDNTCSNDTNSDNTSANIISADYSSTDNTMNMNNEPELEETFISSDENMINNICSLVEEISIREESIQNLLNPSSINDTDNLRGAVDKIVREYLEPLLQGSTFARTSLKALPSPHDGCYIIEPLYEPLTRFRFHYTCGDVDLVVHYLVEQSLRNFIDQCFDSSSIKFTDWDERIYDIHMGFKVSDDNRINVVPKGENEFSYRLAINPHLLFFFRSYAARCFVGSLIILILKNYEKQLGLVSIEESKTFFYNLPIVSLLKYPIFIGGENARQIFGDIEDSLSDTREDIFLNCIPVSRIITCDDLLNLKKDLLKPIYEEHFGYNPPKVPLYADINTTFVVALVESNVVKYQLKDNVDLLREFPDSLNAANPKPDLAPRFKKDNVPSALGIGRYIIPNSNKLAMVSKQLLYKHIPLRSKKKVKFFGDSGSSEFGSCVVDGSIIMDDCPQLIRVIIYSSASHRTNILKQQPCSQECKSKGTLAILDGIEKDEKVQEQYFRDLLCLKTPPYLRVEAIISQSEALDKCDKAPTLTPKEVLYKIWIAIDLFLQKICFNVCNNIEEYYIMISDNQKICRYIRERHRSWLADYTSKDHTNNSRQMNALFLAACRFFYNQDVPRTSRKPMITKAVRFIKKMIKSFLKYDDSVKLRLYTIHNIILMPEDISLTENKLDEFLFCNRFGSLGLCGWDAIINEFQVEVFGSLLPLSIYDSYAMPLELLYIVLEEVKYAMQIRWAKGTSIPNGFRFLIEQEQLPKIVRDLGYPFNTYINRYKDNTYCLSLFVLDEAWEALALKLPKYLQNGDEINEGSSAEIKPYEFVQEMMYIFYNATENFSKKFTNAPYDNGYDFDEVLIECEIICSPHSRNVSTGGCPPGQEGNFYNFVRIVHPRFLVLESEGVGIHEIDQTIPSQVSNLANIINTNDRDRAIGKLQEISQRFFPWDNIDIKYEVLGVRSNLYNCNFDGERELDYTQSIMEVEENPDNENRPIMETRRQNDPDPEYEEDETDSYGETDSIEEENVGLRRRTLPQTRNSLQRGLDRQRQWETNSTDSGQLNSRSIIGMIDSDTLQRRRLEEQQLENTSTVANQVQPLPEQGTGVDVVGGRSIRGGSRGNRLWTYNNEMALIKAWRSYSTGTPDQTRRLPIWVHVISDPDFSNDFYYEKKYRNGAPRRYRFGKDQLAYKFKTLKEQLRKENLFNWLDPNVELIYNEAWEEAYKAFFYQ